MVVIIVAGMLFMLFMVVIIVIGMIFMLNKVVIVVNGMFFMITMIVIMCVEVSAFAIGQQVDALGIQQFDFNSVGSHGFNRLRQ